MPSQVKISLRNSYGLNVMVIATLILSVFFAFSFVPVEALAEPSAEDVFKAAALSESEKQDIFNGEIVEFTRPETSERELALGMMLLIHESPANLMDLFKEAAAFKVISVVTAAGRIEGEGTVADFGGVVLEPNGKEEATGFLKTEPGEELNLSPKEMAAFQALNTQGGGDPQKKVEELLRQTLLARYQAYRAGGLSSIAPYDQDDSDLFQPGKEIRLTTESAKFVAKYFPSFYQYLLQYPDGKPSGVQEQFYWLNFNVFDRPTFVLSHRLALKTGKDYIIADRHYYASHDYNILQSLGMLVPVKEGTLAVFLYRVSTNQVGGFGSSVKHPVARTLMESPLADLYKKLRDRGEKG